MNLEYFLDNELKKDVMDVIIYQEDGSLIDTPDYSEFKVVKVEYEERKDGLYCIIHAKYII